MTNLTAQHPYFYTINDENGLPSNEVYQVLQDDFGYIWIGCDAGLYRYDGFQFKHYYNSKQNGRAISFLQLDSQQRIWCKNFYGQLYRVEGDSLTLQYREATSKPEKPQYTIDENNVCWLVDATHLIALKKNGTEQEVLKLVSLGITNEVIALKYHASNIYLLTDELELYSFEIATKKSNKINGISKPTNTKQSAKLIIHKNSLYASIKYENNKSKIFQLKNNNLELLYQIPTVDNNFRIYDTYSDKNHIWIATSHGAFQMINDSTLSTCYFPNKKISTLFKDREGQYWFTNLHEGIHIVPNIEVNVYNSTNSNLGENNINFIKSIDNLDVWIGSSLGNLYRLQQQKKEIRTQYANETENFINVKAIKNYKNYLIISRGRFCIVDTLSNKQFFPKLSNVRDFEIVDDTVYLVFPEFIAKVSFSNLISTNELSYEKIRDKGGKFIEYNPIYKILYLSISEGTFTYNLETHKWNELHLYNQPIYATQLQNYDSICWIGTLSNGVIGFKNEQIVKVFTIENGLKENTVKSINANASFLWVATDNYLHKINLSNNEFSYYDATHGIYPKDINAIEIIGQNIYLATNKGLVFFPKEMNWENKAKPSLKIISLSLNNEPISYTNTLLLEHDFSNLKINFSSTAFKSKGKFQYAYRIYELDSTYFYVNGNTPYALFSSIPPGRYTFQVKAINESGTESDVVNLTIEVSEPYYQKGWFYLLVLITMAFLFWVVFYFRVRFIRNKAELRNKMISSQLTALKSQMNPHFMFNTLNSLQDLILKNDIKSTNYYLSKYGMLMRRILEYSEKNTILLSEEIELIDTYLQLEKLRFGDDFIFEINVEVNMNTDQIDVPPMILQPFIENAIKHGLLHKKGPKKLTLHFSISNQLICQIEDNGVGRKKSAEINSKFKSKHQSFATQATEKRIELLNVHSNTTFSFEIIDIEENGFALGTVVIIKIPLDSK